MNWHTQQSKTPNALILVAHPDDETIFCAGIMLTYPKWNWHIVCMTGKTTNVRGKQFLNAVKKYEGLGVNIKKSYLLGFVDEVRYLKPTEKSSWSNAIKELNLKPDVVFTHNTKGEYGHPYHIALNSMAYGIYTNIWEFLFIGGPYVITPPAQKEIRAVPLDHKLIKTKLNIFNTCYTSELYLWKKEPKLLEAAFSFGIELYTHI